MQEEQSYQISPASDRRCSYIHLSVSLSFAEGVSVVQRAIDHCPSHVYLLLAMFGRAGFYPLHYSDASWGFVPDPDLE